eukprot:9227334-Alexandrium_andersonii.AAC.1
MGFRCADGAVRVEVLVDEALHGGVLHKAALGHVGAERVAVRRQADEVLRQGVLGLVAGALHEAAPGHVARPARRRPVTPGCSSERKSRRL